MKWNVAFAALTALSGHSFAYEIQKCGQRDAIFPDSTLQPFDWS